MIHPIDTKPATDLEPGDVIGVVFGGYGELLGTFRFGERRDNLLDVTVEAGGYNHATVLSASAEIPVYPAESSGTWRY